MVANASLEGLYKQHGWKLLVFMLHMADISNPAKPHPAFVRWADCCLEEFFMQGDQEMERGLAISPLCDRKTTSRSQSQIGFLQFVVQPAFIVLAAAVPVMQIEVLPIVQENLEYWQNLSKEEAKAKDTQGQLKEEDSISQDDDDDDDGNGDA